eukprot:2512812-Rhodomonas_salina.3
MASCSSAQCEILSRGSSRNWRRPFGSSPVDTSGEGPASLLRHLAGASCDGVESAPHTSLGSQGESMRDGGREETGRKRASDDCVGDNTWGREGGKTRKREKVSQRMHGCFGGGEIELDLEG